LAQEFEDKLNNMGSINSKSCQNSDFPVLGAINFEGKISEFKIPIKNFLGRILICGDSFSGKSSIIKRLLLQIIESTNLNPIIFDDNCEYDKLLDSKWLERECCVIEFGVDNVTINPLELINLENEEYLDILIDIFRESFNLSTEESFILKEFIIALKQDNENPTLSDLLLYLELRDEVINIFDKNTLNKSIIRLKSILTGLTHGPIKEIVDVESSNLNFSKLQDYSIIIKIQSVSKSSRKFIKNLIYFYQLLFKEHFISEDPHLMVVDSIDDICTSLIKFNSISNLNEGLLASITTPLGKKSNILDFFNSFIILNISSRDDINKISKKLCLEKIELINNIRMGTSIVKISDNPIYIVEIDDFYF